VRGFQFCLDGPHLRVNGIPYIRCGVTKGSHGPAQAFPKRLQIIMPSLTGGRRPGLGGFFGLLHGSTTRLNTSDGLFIHNGGRSFARCRRRNRRWHRRVLRQLMRDGARGTLLHGHGLKRLMIGRGGCLFPLVGGAKGRRGRHRLSGLNRLGTKTAIHARRQRAGGHFRTWPSRVLTDGLGRRCRSRRDLGRSRLRGRRGHTILPIVPVRGRRTLIDLFFKSLQGLPHSLTNLREPPRSKNDQNDYQNDDQFLKSKGPKHRKAFTGKG